MPCNINLPTIDATRTTRTRTAGRTTHLRTNVLNCWWWWEACVGLVHCSTRWRGRATRPPPVIHRHLWGWYKRVCKKKQDSTTTTTRKSVFCLWWFPCNAVDVPLVNIVLRNRKNTIVVPNMPNVDPTTVKQKKINPIVPASCQEEELSGRRVVRKKKLPGRSWQESCQSGNEWKWTQAIVDTLTPLTPQYPTTDVFRFD